MTWYPVVNDLIGGWAVAQSPNPMSQRAEGEQVAADFIASEAVANIIAFALNAVAEGHDLFWCAQTNDVLVPYNGPTEGVAPNANQ